MSGQIDILGIWDKIDILKSVGLKIPRGDDRESYIPGHAAGWILVTDDW